ncbi:4a-hydroxytetrahydrobiopterin dehydratase [Nocardioides marmoriginsengisoli]|uniref:Putative pterin-4-alpha-carbinolamine dehydratase n=1 Tax=Nocardioides marmoriginsengisoli TaxID=661483 RepID=A0A3N0CBK3_9ACTN|nr:4a-hydroxytetrahydrobiopterin dehydratase [Nocardioides marmoriginsengisoli]RNL60699.1 4a-hydroxytetrahydrobiopterin dehydratase [Nocardioides marmoriginsengisoli]
MSTEKLTGQQISDAGLTGWTYLLGGLQTRIHTRDFATGLQVVNAIGAAAEALNHHPDLDLRYPRVDVRLSSHDVGGVTERDLVLAREISSIAASVGAEVECATVSRVELGLDSPDGAAIAPFWAAVLGMKHEGGEDWNDIADPYDVLPLIWTQPSGSDEPRQRWHPDLWVDPDRVQPLIDAAIAAGGTLVSDERAPRFWVLADAEGNKVCLCTWQGRS